MSVISLAIIGKNNEPLYLKEFLDSEIVPDEELLGLKASPRQLSCSLRQQFLLHAALDRFEQIEGPPPGCGWRKPGATGIDAMFAGLLCPIEDMRVYGYMTTTNIKFILCVDDDPAGMSKSDTSLKKLFVQIHQIYAEYILNPFSVLSSTINSKRFDQKLEDWITAYNQSAA